MAITGINSYTAYAGYPISANKNNTPESAQAAANTPKTEKAGSTPREYKQYLTEKYDCLKSQDYTVTIHASLLNQAAGDKEKAAWLEENLALIPQTMEKMKATVEASGGEVLSCHTTIDGYGSMTTELCTRPEAGPGTEKAGETWLDKLQKKTTEKAAEKRAGKRQDNAEQTERLIAKGKSLKTISGKILAGNGITPAASTGNRLDITA